MFTINQVSFFIRIKFGNIKIIFFLNKILEEQKINNSMLNRFLKHYDIYFLVIVNPDGYDSHNLSQLNFF